MDKYMENKHTNLTKYVSIKPFYTVIYIHMNYFKQVCMHTTFLYVNIWNFVNDEHPQYPL